MSASPSAEFGRERLVDFRLDPAVTFLNHGSFGATPNRVLAAQDGWRTEMERQPVRFFTRTFPAAVRTAAASFAGFLGAEPDNLVFTENPSGGSAAVLLALRLQPGDRILVTDHGYGAVRQAVRRTADATGAALDTLPVPVPWVDDTAFLTALEASLAIHPKPRLFVVDAITSPTAIRLPFEAAAAMARRAGVPVLVDAAHAPGSIPLDLGTLDADWVVGTAHKWLFAPKGCGFLHAREPWRSRTNPAVVSHYHLHGFTRAFDWIGTRDPTAWLSIDAAIAAWRDFGGWELARRNADLADFAVTELGERFGFAVSAPRDRRAGMAAMRIGPGTRETGLVLHDRLLDGHGIEIPVMAQGGQMWLRLSAQVYNEAGDYRRLGDALAAILQ